MYKVVLLKGNKIIVTLRERFETFEEAQRAAVKGNERLADRPKDVKFAPVREVGGR